MGTLNKGLHRFQPEYLHEELGLNLIMPVLPMHGPRDTGGLISGERTLSGDVMDTLHTGAQAARSEEHTSELQSLAYLVCRLLLEKKKKNNKKKHLTYHK